MNRTIDEALAEALKEYGLAEEQEVDGYLAAMNEWAGEKGEGSMP